MSVESTREVMTRYWQPEGGGMSTLDNDVVFTIMGTGQQFRGPDAVRGMLSHFYREAFDARAEPINAIFADDHAVLEATFVGKHIGEFEKIPPTGKEIRVPLCVVYHLENDKIKEGHVYFQIDALRRQLGME